MEAKIELTKEDVAKIIGKHFNLNDVYVEFVTNNFWISPREGIGPDCGPGGGHMSRPDINPSTIVIKHKKVEKSYV